MALSRIRLALQTAAIMIAAVFTLFASPADATMTQVFGGPGGSPYSLVCANGSFLVGFYAKAGGWVDSVGLLCAPYDPASRQMQHNFVHGPATGGAGGSPQEAYCVLGEAVTAIGVAFTRGGGLDRQYTNTIDIYCPTPNPSRCISSGEGCGQIASKFTGPTVSHEVFYLYDKMTCPSEERATGIQGKSGIYVDSMGLICAPLPTAAVAPQPPPAPVAATQFKQTGASKNPGRVFNSAFEAGIDIPGDDYRNFPIDGAVAACQDTCARDSACKAWTWVKPGVQNAKAMCWLKNGVPAPVANLNATSGIKTTGDNPR